MWHVRYSRLHRNYFGSMSMNPNDSALYPQLPNILLGESCIDCDCSSFGVKLNWAIHDNYYGNIKDDYCTARIMIVHVTSAHDHSVAVLVIFPDLFLQLSEHTLFGHAYFCLEGGKQLREVHPTLFFRHVPLFLDAPTEGRGRESNEGWVRLGEQCQGERSKVTKITNNRTSSESSWVMWPTIE